ncbi:MAG: hypothetical protein ABW090_15740 [Sedimenticola sp.]
MAGGESERRRADMGVIVALPVECAAVLSVLDGYEVLPPTQLDPNTYYLGKVVTAGSEKGAREPTAVVVAQCPKMGNNGSAMVAKDLIRSFRTQHIVMVGIAAGIPSPKSHDKHVRLGDVVVSYGAGVVQYDLMKRHPDGRLEIRSTLPPASRILTGAVDFLETARLQGDVSWTKHIERTGQLGQRPPDSSDVLHILRGKSSQRWIKLEHPNDDRTPGVPKVHRGLIGSGNCLMKDVTERDRLAQDEGILALEMEGAGIADAAWNQSEVADYLVIRGISDYADREKNNVWQPYAAAVAAAYFRAVIMTDVIPFAGGE